MQITINSDQAGFDLKEYLKSRLLEANFDVKDFSEAQDYYCDNTLKAVQDFVVGGYDRAILIHQNVYAAAILANRFPGVRAAVCNDVFTARKMITYGNANVAVLDSELEPQKAWDLVRIWTAGEFSKDYLAEKNQQLDMIEEIDQSLLRSDWKSTLQVY